MTTTIQKMFIGAAALASAAAMATAASAGCGAGPVKLPASWQAASGDPSKPLLTLASTAPAAVPGPAAIVGLWSVRFVVGGHLFDWGYQAWHSDGTEILNSGSRAPATENFCMGVWAQTAWNKYALNHFALSYDAGTGALNAKVNIKAQVGLDSTGNKFSGPFTLNVYDPKNGALLQSASGTLEGARVTVF